jgi:hypothetical protein
MGQTGSQGRKDNDAYRNVVEKHVYQVQYTGMIDKEKGE